MIGRSLKECAHDDELAGSAPVMLVVRVDRK